MNKLSSYDLQRGDWVKFVNDGWLEFEGYNDFNQHIFNYHSYICNHSIEAVLRPSIIIRDELNRFLGYANSYLGETANEMISFKILHPRKEEKSLYQKMRDICPIGSAESFLDADKEIDKVFKELCDRIEALEKESKK